ncbi:MAG: type IV pili methyl-accepting chemotaxis transducer N-terminal domain-containing protein [Hyphomicrobiaceae bacterium]
MLAIRTGVLAGFFMCSVMTGAFAQALAQNVAATEAITAKTDGKRKINLSGRQRMLSQYMAKAVCFANLRVDEKLQLDELQVAHHLFERTLVELRDGSPVQRMLPEEDLKINTALDEVEKVWYVYGKAVKVRDMVAVVDQNLAVLSKSNDVVTLFQKKYGAADTVAPEIAAALNVSGRQRMLTQKASKEFCLVASGMDGTGNRTALKATLELFDKSMAGLKDGSAELGLGAAPSKAIIDQIGKVNDAWTPMKAIFGKVAEGGAPSPEDVAAISKQNVAVMEAANVIVGLYEAAGAK